MKYTHRIQIYMQQSTTTWAREDKRKTNNNRSLTRQVSESTGRVFVRQNMKKTTVGDPHLIHT